MFLCISPLIRQQSARTESLAASATLGPASLPGSGNSLHCRPKSSTAQRCQGKGGGLITAPRAVFQSRHSCQRAGAGPIPPAAGTGGRQSCEGSENSRVVVATHSSREQDVCGEGSRENDFHCNRLPGGNRPRPPPSTFSIAEPVSAGKLPYSWGDGAPCGSPRLSDLQTASSAPAPKCQWYIPALKARLRSDRPTAAPGHFPCPEAGVLQQPAVTWGDTWSVKWGAMDLPTPYSQPLALWDRARTHWSRKVFGFTVALDRGGWKGGF